MDFRPVLASAAALAAVLAPLSGHAQTAGANCRNVSQTITIDGRPQQAVTFMCQQVDGSWAPAASPGASAQAVYPPPVQTAYAAPAYDYYDPYYSYYGPGWGYYPAGGVFIGGHFGGQFGGGHFSGGGGGHGGHGGHGHH